MAHLHSQVPPLVHRDVKPANILITRASGSMVAKICDFGVAKVVEKQDGKTRLFGTYCGTEAFMAPELFIEDKNALTYSIKVDIYSLGLFFFIFLEAKSMGKLEQSKKTRIHPFSAKAIYNT